MRITAKVSRLHERLDHTRPGKRLDWHRWMALQGNPEPNTVSKFGTSAAHSYTWNGDWVSNHLHGGMKVLVLVHRLGSKDCGDDDSCDPRHRRAEILWHITSSSTCCNRSAHDMM